MIVISKGFLFKSFLCFCRIVSWVYFDYVHIRDLAIILFSCRICYHYISMFFVLLLSYYWVVSDFAMFYSVLMLIFYIFDYLQYHFPFLALFLCFIALFFCFCWVLVHLYSVLIHLYSVLLMVICIFCLFFRLMIIRTFG